MSSNSRSCRWRRNNKGMVQRTLLEVGLGQLVSFNLSILTLAASLVSRQVDAPLTLSFTTYLALSVVYGSIMLYRRQKLLVPWYWYALLGFVDIHGNYLVNKAFQYTSITSVTILDCWTVAWAMVLTWIFLGAKYTWWQFVGAGICVGGLGIVLLSDAGLAGGGGSNPLLGDSLVIAGTICFAISNVAEEFCVKKKDRIEVLTMIGVFGMLLSALERYPWATAYLSFNFIYYRVVHLVFITLIYSAIVERKTLESVNWSAGLILGYVGYATASFLFYTLVPFVLKISGATLCNLSLLTSDMWVVLFRIFIYKQKVDWLYYVAFVLVVLGIFIYSETSGKDDQNSKAAGAPEDNNEEYCLVVEQD